MPKYFFRWIGVFIVLTFLGGCAAGKQTLPVYDGQFQSGCYDQAAATALKHADFKEPEDTIVWLLEAGAAEQALGHFEESIKCFDACEAGFQHHELENSALKVAKDGATLLVNDSIRAYQGEEYDKIMANTYKAMAWAAYGDFGKARVEFNRAIERQQRAKEYYQKEIAKARKEIEEQDQKLVKENKKSPASGNGIQKSVESDEMRTVLAKRYSNLDNFEAYPDFVNPFSTYMAGLFFLLENDNAKAKDLLKAAYGMNPSNTRILEDLAYAEGDKKMPGSVWVIFENGMGPRRKEIRIDLPLFLLTNKVKYIGGALPQIELRNSAYQSLTVQGTSCTATTCSVGDMDRVVQTEFKKDFPLIVMRAVMSTTLKTLIQYQAQKQMGNLGGILASVYQAATTAADIRGWTALPKEFQAARVDMPSNGMLSISTPMGEQFEIPVPKSRHAIVLIKIPAPGVLPAWNVIPFGQAGQQVAKTL